MYNIYFKPTTETQLQQASIIKNYNIVNGTPWHWEYIVHTGI